jgi:hypothetical protein
MYKAYSKINNLKFIFSDEGTKQYERIQKLGNGLRNGSYSAN